MNHLWSPWRMAYLDGSNKVDGCVFCVAPSMQDSAENLIAHRGKRAYVILNLYPYTSGHLLIVPFEHKSNLEDLDPETRAEMMELASQSMTVLRSLYQPQGFNMGANLGAAAGAGVPEHVHLHIVPRWLGDTNFISTLGQTRVLPEALADTYERIKNGFQKI